MAKTKEENRAYQKAWREAHPDRCAEYAERKKVWLEDHLEVQERYRTKALIRMSEGHDAGLEEGLALQVETLEKKPKIPKGRRAFSLARQKIFLRLLAKSGNLGHCARMVGVTYGCVRKRRLDDIGFDEEVTEALEMSIGVWEDCVAKRAFEGIDEQVIYRGKRMMEENAKGEVIPFTVKKYSDKLAQFMLRGARPEKYGGGSGAVMNVDKAVIQINLVKPDRKFDE